MRLLSAVFLLLLISCQRDNSFSSVPDVQLTGTWQLVEIKDKSTGAVLTYPAGTSERIQFTLLADGSYSGKTRVNLFSGGSYTLPSAGKILFGAPGMMTKVAEDPLGIAFIEVLQNCFLQSINPCVPATYNINGNNMDIQTSLRYDVKMLKL